MITQEQSISTYGVRDIEAFRASAEKSLCFETNPTMVIMSILSDAQELIAVGNKMANEEARTTINRAKYLLNVWK